MHRLASLLAVLLIPAFSIEAAMVVTAKERIVCTIISQDDKSLTLRLENQREMKIARDKVLQIFDDAGDLTWQGALPPEELRPEPVEQRPPSFAKRSVLLDFYLGSAFGGLYADENKLVDDLKIYTQYSDGSVQYAKSSMLSLGGGISYQNFDSDRWSTLISYLYKTTSQSVTIGENASYEKSSLANLVVTRRHALFYGKEAHFYPASDVSSLDIIGQIGYELGSYAPLTTYNSYRTMLTPMPAAYTGAASIIIHGPTARLGTGVTLRGENWQFRLLGFYQLTTLFLAATTPLTNSQSTIVHDLYGGVSLGYGW